MRYFLAVAQELNFSRAAERLHMAQPPLTRQIQAIEDELGTPLFVRVHKGVELTDAGTTLLAEVPNILALVERSHEKTRLAGRGMIGRLDVGTFGSGIFNVVPRVLASYRASRPHVKIGLHNMTKSEQIQALRERRITVGFARLVPAEPGITVETVLREPIVVGLHEDHPLARKNALTVQDLEDEPVILYPALGKAGLAETVVDTFRLGGTRLRIEQEVEDGVTAIALVASRFGLCVTTESASSLKLPGVVYRPLRSPHLRDIELSCFYLADEASPVLAEFLRIVRQYGADHARSR